MVHAQHWVPALPPARPLPGCQRYFSRKPSLIQLSLQKNKTRFNDSKPVKVEEPSVAERVLASVFFNRRILFISIWKEQVKNKSQC